MTLAHAPVAPSDLWGAWPFEPLVALGLLVAVFAYARGHRRLHRRSTVRAAAFAGGVLAVAVALLTPLDGAADTLFSAHMVQHLVLMVVAAPLLVVGRVVGRPVTAMLVGLPGWARRTTARVRAPLAATGLARALRRPVMAWIVLTMTLWAWHTPSLYTAALQHSAVHALEHAFLLLTSVLAWSVALSSASAQALGALGRALLLVASAVQGGLLGAVLLFARTPLYPVHGPGPALWGLTPLEDQQLAGALMWIPPSVVYLGAAAGVLLGAFRAMDVRARVDGAEVVR